MWLRISSPPRADGPRPGPNTPDWPTLEPRIVPAPVRMPLPVALNQGPLYENQRAAGRRYFDVHDRPGGHS